mmetsp:Transcript_53502/g.98966  ORF Transcript_53502/g.98966 Transcript_53502/m.98966 type:complete len:92 (+) Transcript_53502:62-337(+)
MSAEERLAEALDHVAQKLLEKGVAKEDAPAAALEALCERVPKLQDGAEMRSLVASGTELEARLVTLQTKLVKLGRADLIMQPGVESGDVDM